MGFTPKLLAQGATSAGTVTIGPSGETWHIKYAVFDSDASTTWEVQVKKSGGSFRTVGFFSNGISAGAPIGSVASDDGSLDNWTQGTLDNLMLEDGDQLKLTRTTGTGETDYTICGYAIT